MFVRDLRKSLKGVSGDKLVLITGKTDFSSYHTEAKKIRIDPDYIELIGE